MRAAGEDGRVVRVGGSSRRPLGQHFLRDAGVVSRILDALGARPGDAVVEIGPGTGALTRPLLARGAKVLAVELDARLAGRLEDELGPKGLAVVRGNALDVDLGAALVAAGATPPVPFVSNLPYESSTPILRAAARRPDLFVRMVVMLQKEVAERLVARPRDEAYGYLTLDVGAHAKVRKLFDVHRGAFDPPPKVSSTVVEVTPFPPAPGAAAALRVASAAFHVRRKTLANGLTALWGRDHARAAIAALGLPETVRAEELSLETFLALAERLGPGR